jgi:hypothetical protein
MTTSFRFLRRPLGLALLLTLPFAALAQVPGVGIGTATPNGSAALDVSSTTQGLLPPRMSQAQRDAINPAATAAGLLIFNTSTNTLNTWDGVKWVAVLADTTPAPVMSFAYTGAAQTYIVPAGVTGLTIDLAGAAGGVSDYTPSAVGGLGGRVQARLAVTPGQQLSIYVGQAGPTTNTSVGGFNGGGNSFDGTGGGASDIRVGGTALANRVLVAGGGGGGGNLNGGGAGGGLTGQAGIGHPANDNYAGIGTGGGGGTQLAGGAAGMSSAGFNSSGPFSNGSAGSLGQGGNYGGNTYNGGGGGGYYGGGSGGSNAGGGGGSSYAGTGTSAVTHTQGYRSGNGYVSIVPAIVPDSPPAPYLNGTNITGVIRNQTTLQEGASFNIDGSGTMGSSTVSGNSTVAGSSTVSGSSTVAGNLGIGTASPGTGRLYVLAADNSLSPIASFQPQNQTQGVSITFNGIAKAGSAAASNLTLDGKGSGHILLHTGSTGNVGIGTTSPTQKLDVVGNATISGNTTVGGNATISGSVGIGTTSTAGARLGVVGSGGSTVDLTVNGRLRSGDASNSGGLWTDGAQTQFVGQYSASTLGIYNNGAWRMLVGNSDNLSTGSGAVPTNLYGLYTFRTQLTADGDGQATIFGYRTRNSQNDGTDYSLSGTNAAVKGYNHWGDLYTFGTTGFNDNDFTRTGGVLGAITGGGYWGALGYRSSGSTGYGIYGSAAYASGAGRPAPGSPGGVVREGIGLGIYGGALGGWVHGDALGLVSSGGTFAAYNVGDEYTSGRQAELVTDGQGQRQAAFSMTATESKTYEDGVGQLTEGRATVAWPAGFAALLGGVPVVTVTPVGECRGLHLVSLSREGFTVAENGQGTASLAFTWIAVGRRLDATTHPAVPAELLDPAYDQHLREVMVNDGDATATPLWHDGQRTQFTPRPAAAPLPKPAR